MPRRACLRFAARGWVAPVLAPGRPLDSQQLEGGRSGEGSVRLARNVRRPWLSRNEKTLPHFRGMDRLFQAIIAAGDAHHFVRGTRVRERAYTPVPVAQAKPASVEELQAGPSRRKRPF